jgi:hypothetical protein
MFASAARSSLLRRRRQVCLSNEVEVTHCDKRSALEVRDIPWIVSRPHRLHHKTARQLRDGRSAPDVLP